MCFLNICLLFAIMFQTSVNHRVLEVFQVCETRDILTELSRFYEEWAMKMESSGNMIKADEIYNRGLVKAKDSTLKLKEAYK